MAKKKVKSRRQKGYVITLVLLVVLAVLTAMAFKLIDRQQQKIDSLKFKVDLLYSKLDIKVPVEVGEKGAVEE